MYVSPPFRLFLIRFLSLLGILGFSLFFYSISMDVQSSEAGGGKQSKTDVYSVWAIPAEEVTARVKKVMLGLRSEFGGPEFEPHVTVVGAIRLTEEEARERLKKSCEGLKGYNVTVEKVATGSFFYQCVFLLLRPTNEVMKAGAHCWDHFGFKSPTPYMPHLSILYGDLTNEQKQRAQEKANALDESVKSLSFPITRFALYKTDTEDKTLKSWEKVTEITLQPN
ncbi:hypothetical protein OSB04_002126 [Centaurea solstitialis]|uniref:RNA ligase/cyclic nucleotide phosphodiesterase family protein n=1 Tax=Centaurea solstitialis TaxID=347529 RepID=A0AA38TSC5_9ASTR|nr:hypothetical protein OSB04_002126 [Centaurea solstitialis]